MVDTTDPYAGIFATLSANPSLTSIGQALRLRKQLREASPAGTGVPIARTKELIPQLSELPGLAPTDYSGQRDEANQMAKLQLGLALAARGFGSMGAQPRPGEMAISTVGRELLAPLGGDAMTVAQQLYDQKLKRRAAEKAEKAALSQAALSLAASEQEGELGFIDAALKAELGRTTTDKGGTYKGHLVVVDNNTGLARLDDQNRRVEVSLGRGNKPYVIGTDKPYIQPPNTSLMSLTDYNAAIKRKSRTDAVLSEMSRLQGQQRGAGKTYSARSGLYWDQSRYVKGEFPFMYASNPDDPNTYKPIKDPKIQDLINNKVNALANTMLQSNFGEQTAEVKSDRIARAVRSILESPAYIWFGGQEIPSIGYVPVDPTLATASNRVIAKDVMTTLSDDPDGTVDARHTLSVLPYAPNAEDLSRIAFRLRVASDLFPDAFGAPLIKATGTLEEWKNKYDPAQAQERADIEAAIRNARLLPNATRADHRAAIQEAAREIAKARNKEQTKRAAGLAEEEVRMRLEWRRALLAFRNAAAETEIEGFVTGPFASTFSKIGLAKWIVGDGSLHWDRLTQASDRLAEGYSRKIGKDFGDDKISNYDAQAYKNLVANIRQGGAYNKILVEDGLALINRELEGLMQLGGKVGYSARLLEEVAQAGVDFSKLKTQLNWHGHGFYGGNRYSASRQRTPSLSIENRDHIRRSGELLDTMYDNKYIVPNVAYDGNPLQFSAGLEEGEKKTETTRMGDIEFNRFITDRAKALGVSYQEMFDRVVEGILSYNIFRETMGGE